MADGGKVNLQGFGTFEARGRKGRTGRNPRTGDPIDIKATTVPAFSASKPFKDQVRVAVRRDGHIGYQFLGHVEHNGYPICAGMGM